LQFPTTLKTKGRWFKSGLCNQILFTFSYFRLAATIRSRECGLLASRARARGEL